MSAAESQEEEEEERLQRRVSGEQRVVRAAAEAEVKVRRWCCEARQEEEEVAPCPEPALPNIITRGSVGSASPCGARGNTRGRRHTQDRKAGERKDPGDVL